ncbi:MAG: polyketide synthase dehydratase domain-containing protein, partial [Aestuariivirga sp.]|uniref:polyketide synthase dehydratase domain-containing protein n=1 Tax=Aestuariivirga sp. TaxID=2650926 RepID=UPI00301A2C4D
MLAVFASGARIAVALGRYPSVSLAADNGLHRVVSGPAGMVAALADELTGEGVRCERLRTSHAFHSQLMDPVLDALEEACGGLAVSAAGVGLVSNVTGRLVGPAERMDGAYWRAHARAPVVFAQGIESLAGLGIDCLLEVGPHGVLAPMAGLCWPSGERPRLVASLQRARDGADGAGAFAGAVAAVYAAGAALSFPGLFAGEERARVPLPGYPLQRQRYWVDTRKQRAAAAHGLLGTRHDSARGEVTFETELSAAEPAWLADHQVFGRIVVPGAFYAILALSAGKAAGERTGSASWLEEFEIHAPLVLEDGTQHSVQIVLGAPEGAVRSVEIFSRAGAAEDFVLHARGRLAAGAYPARDALDRTAAAGDLTTVDTAVLYGGFSRLGLDYGAAFRGVHSLGLRPGEALGELWLEGVEAERHLLLHPALLDAAFQLCGAILPAAAGESTYMPIGWKRLTLAEAVPGKLLAQARLRGGGSGLGGNASPPETITFDVGLFSEEGRWCGAIEGFTVKKASRTALLAGSGRIDDLFYETVWKGATFGGGLRPAGFLAQPLGIVASASAGAAEHLSAEGLTSQDLMDSLAGLERLSQAYALSALEGLGWKRRKGDLVCAEPLRQNLKVLLRHGRLLQRLLVLLADAGILALVKAPAGATPTWQVLAGQGDALPDPELTDPERFADDLAAAYPKGFIEVSLLRRCGQALSGVLRGQLDPLGLLFVSEGPSAADLYRDAPAARVANALVADIIGKAIAQLPQGRRLRILEVGAGTGGTTGSILSVLPKDRFSYTYTDLSASFFGSVRARFGEYGLTCRTLDIEIDPQAQGYSAHGYDLVIAANVLHATRDIGVSLAHCRTLLAPSGLLVALEGLKAQGWLDLTFGLLEGWWSFEDPWRPDHALMGAARWQAVLSETGFHDAAVIAADGARLEVASQGVILARGPSAVVDPEAMWLVLAPGDDGLALATGLAARNQQVIWVESTGMVAEGWLPPGVRLAFADPSCREAWQALIAALPVGVALDGVVHGEALGEGAGELWPDVARISASALALSQALQDAGRSLRKGLTFLTRGAIVTGQEPAPGLSGAALWGFARSLAQEASPLAPRLIDLDAANRSRAGDPLPAGLIDILLDPDQEGETALRASGRLASRVMARRNTGALVLPQGPYWQLVRSADGLIGNVHAQAFVPRSLQPGEVRVSLDATGLNFRDVLNALNAYPGFAGDLTGHLAGALGGEFCGRVIACAPDVESVQVGDRVVGLGAETFAPETITFAELVTQVPPVHGAAALASLPVAYVTVELAFRLAHLKAGERVLVHAGAGGVGLAAIALARVLGAEVIATASEGKRAMLRGLGVAHVFDSRSTRFAADILAVTGGA